MRNERVLTVRGRNFSQSACHPLGQSILVNIGEFLRAVVFEQLKNLMNTLGSKGLSSVAQLTDKLCSYDLIDILLQSGSLLSK